MTCSSTKRRLGMHYPDVIPRIWVGVSQKDPNVRSTRRARVLLSQFIAAFVEPTTPVEINEVLQDCCDVRVDACSAGWFVFVAFDYVSLLPPGKSSAHLDSMHLKNILTGFRWASFRSFLCYDGSGGPRSTFSLCDSESQSIWWTA